MSDLNNIQLSYCLLHLTHDDLDVINNVLKCMPGIDLNHFGLSLLFLGHMFCSEKQKVFLNGPMNDDFENTFKKPIRLRFDKNTNSKLFNIIKRTPQGKLRRNFLTAVIHAGVSTFIELVYLYKTYKALNDISNLYSLNTFALKFGLDTCLNKFSEYLSDTYEYNTSHLINKFNKHLVNEISPVKNISKSNQKNSDRHITESPKGISTTKKPQNTVDDKESISKTEIITQVEKKNTPSETSITPNNTQTNSSTTTVQPTQKSTEESNNNSNWLEMAFDLKLL